MEGLVTVPVQLNVGKESKEAFDALGELVDVVLDKEKRKDVSAYLEKFGAIMEGAKGGDLIDDEMKDKAIRADTIAYFTKVIQDKIK